MHRHYTLASNIIILNNDYVKNKTDNVAHILFY